MIDTVGEVKEAVERGYTLPAEWYSSQEVYALERERIFARTWQYVGRSELVAEPGQYLASYAGHVPVVVVRDHDGRLNAFVNVCRHRGTEVASGCGRRQTLQCPYHAWTYGLDGSLRVAPRSEREPDFDKSEWGLFPVQADTWGPFVFVNPDVDAGPLAEHLGELPSLVAESGLNLSALRFRERVEWEMDVNWKIGIENYLECYHCPVAHPSFSKLYDVDPDAYLLRSSPTFSSQFGPVRESALSGNGRGVPYVPRGEVKQAQYHLLWPNTTINIEAGRANLSIDRSIPDGPHRTVGTSDYFFAEDVPEETAREMIAFGQQVAAEDKALVEAVQRGLDSNTVLQGRLLLSSEHLIQHFQRLVVESLAA